MQLLINNLFLDGKWPIIDNLVYSNYIILIITTIDGYKYDSEFYRVIGAASLWVKYYHPLQENIKFAAPLHPLDATDESYIFYISIVSRHKNI